MEARRGRIEERKEKREGGKELEDHRARELRVLKIYLKSCAFGLSFNFLLLASARYWGRIQISSLGHGYGRCDVVLFVGMDFGFGFSLGVHLVFYIECGACIKNGALLSLQSGLSDELGNLLDFVDSPCGR
jgi:hypothetical protein